jgi:hypothetical protein
VFHGCPPSPDAWGRLNVVTPFHHLSGDSHLHPSLGAGGPLRHLNIRSYPAVLVFTAYGLGLTRMSHNACSAAGQFNAARLRHRLLKDINPKGVVQLTH